jgi:uncharacterized protein (UPF0212 family)
MNQYRILAARLNNDLSQIEKVVQTAVSQVNKAKNTRDLDYLQPVELSLFL